MATRARRQSIKEVYDDMKNDVTTTEINWSLSVWVVVVALVCCVLPSWVVASAGALVCLWILREVSKRLVKEELPPHEYVLLEAILYYPLVVLRKFLNLSNFFQYLVYIIVEKLIKFLCIKGRKARYFCFIIFILSLLSIFGVFYYLVPWDSKLTYEKNFYLIYAKLFSLWHSPDAFSTFFQTIKDTELVVTQDILKPFVPVLPKHEFFNRSLEIMELQKFLPVSHKSGTTVCLIGNKNVGKTALIQECLRNQKVYYVSFEKVANLHSVFFALTVPFQNSEFLKWSQNKNTDMREYLEIATDKKRIITFHDIQHLTEAIEDILNSFLKYGGTTDTERFIVADEINQLTNLNDDVAKYLLRRFILFARHHQYNVIFTTSDTYSGTKFRQYKLAEYISMVGVCEFDETSAISYLMSLTSLTHEEASSVIAHIGQRPATIASYARGRMLQDIIDENKAVLNQLLRHNYRGSVFYLYSCMVKTYYCDEIEDVPDFVIENLTRSSFITYRPSSGVCHAHPKTPGFYGPANKQVLDLVKSTFALHYLTQEEKLKMIQSLTDSTPHNTDLSLPNLYYRMKRESPKSNLTALERVVKASYPVLSIEVNSLRLKLWSLTVEALEVTIIEGTGVAPTKIFYEGRLLREDKDMRALREHALLTFS